MRSSLLICVVTLFVLQLSGCASKFIYVDVANKTGPWDGSKTNPYRKIQDGLNKAKSVDFDGVIVSGGIYNENVVVEDGLSLMPAKGSTTVLVQGSTLAPTITTKGRNYVGGLQIDGGSSGISIEVGKILSLFDNPLTLVTDNLIESKNGIEVVTPGNLSFSAGVRKKPKVAITGNWIRKGMSPGGTGIKISLTGPKTGQLALDLDISDNIVWDKAQCIALSATGQGPNPGGFVRANIIGEVANNLLYGCSLSGLRMDSDNLGNAAVLVINNTLVNGGGHAIVATTSAGPDGDASTHPNITNNVLAHNKGIGYLENSKKTSASDLQNNIFYNNSQGHYEDFETSKTINAQADLNTPIVQNKVVFYSGSGNLVANPQFQKGTLQWNGKSFPGDKAGEFFLVQKGSNKSPGVDTGFGSALNARVSKKTTSVTYDFDTGTSDIGFHYTKE